MFASRLLHRVNTLLLGTETTRRNFCEGIF